MAGYMRTWLERAPDKELGPTDLVGLLVDAEWMHREIKKLTSHLRNSRLRQTTCLEDIDYSLARGLTKAQVMELSTSRWVAQAQNVLVTGPSGVGKSFLACALGQKACRDGYGVVYRRASRLFDGKRSADHTFREKGEPFSVAFQEVSTWDATRKQRTQRSRGRRQATTGRRERHRRCSRRMRRAGCRWRSSPPHQRLRWWKKRRAEQESPALSFVPVHVAAPQSRAARKTAEGASMEVVLARGRRIRVEPGFDASELARLVRALEEAC